MELLDNELMIDLDETSTADKFCNTPDGLADIVRRGNYFAQENGQLYYYKDGVYRAGAERSIQLAIIHIMRALINKGWSTYRGKEVVNYIAYAAPPLLDKPTLHRINLRNGIYNTTTNQLEPHDPTYRTTVQLNIHYDAEAKCPAWDNFIKTVFHADEDSQRLGYEIPAWLMVPYTESQKSVVLLGSGANGKSIYLSGIEEFLGKANICNVSLQKLGDRFTTTVLIGKLANISPDLPNTKITSTGEFKALTGGDSLAGEYKNGGLFRFFPFARCLFACNELPDTPDASDGFYRRINIVEFHRKFKDDPDMGRRLKLALTSEAEISGLFNRALEALPRVLQNGITVTERMKNAAEEHRRENDPVAQWLDEYTTLDENDWIEKKDLFVEYKQTGNSGKAARNNIAFGRAIKRYRPTVVAGQRRENGLVITTYEGIRLKTEIEDMEIFSAADDSHMRPSEQEPDINDVPAEGLTPEELEAFEEHSEIEMEME